jgi:hypothetical protein
VKVIANQRTPTRTRFDLKTEKRGIANVALPDDRTTKKPLESKGGKPSPSPATTKSKQFLDEPPAQQLPRK